MLTHVFFEVSKVLPILMNQIGITAFPFLPILVDPDKMARDSFEQLLRQVLLEGLLNAKVCAIDRQSWVDLLFETLHVGEGVFEISF